MLVEAYDYYEDADGKHIIRTMVESDFKMRRERKYISCSICPVDCFPECMKTCGKWKTSKSLE